MPDDDPIPDDPNQQLKEVEVAEETVRNNSNAVAHSVPGLVGDEKSWALKQKMLPWFWKGKEESAEETQEEEEEKEEKKVPWSSFPLERKPLHDTDDEETEVNSDEESDDPGFDSDIVEKERAAGKKEKASLGPLLGLALGSALLGGSLGYCSAR